MLVAVVGVVIGVVRGACARSMARHVALLMLLAVRSKDDLLGVTVTARNGSHLIAIDFLGFEGLGDEIIERRLLLDWRWWSSHYSGGWQLTSGLGCRWQHVGVVLVSHLVLSRTAWLSEAVNVRFLRVFSFD